MLSLINSNFCLCHLTFGYNEFRKVPDFMRGTPEKVQYYSRMLLLHSKFILFKEGLLTSIHSFKNLCFCL